MCHICSLFIPHPTTSFHTPQQYGREELGWFGDAQRSQAARLPFSPTPHHVPPSPNPLLVSYYITPKFPIILFLPNRSLRNTYGGRFFGFLLPNIAASSGSYPFIYSERYHIVHNIEFDRWMVFPLKLYRVSLFWSVCSLFFLSFFRYPFFVLRCVVFVVLDFN